MSEMNYDHIATLEALGWIEIGHRPDSWVKELNINPWFAGFRDLVEIGDGVTRTSLHGNGSTPEEAIEDLYRAMTDLQKDQFVVIYHDQTRIQYVFDGRQFVVDKVVKEEGEYV